MLRGLLVSVAFSVSNFCSLIPSFSLLPAVFVQIHGQVAINVDLLLGEHLAFDLFAFEARFLGTLHLLALTLHEHLALLAVLVTLCLSLVLKLGGERLLVLLLLLRFGHQELNVFLHGSGVGDSSQLYELKDAVDVTLNFDELESRVHSLIRCLRSLLIIQVASS